MTIYAKDEIRAGIVMEKDAPWEAMPRSKPSAPKYGDASFAQVSQKLDQARLRLEKIRDALRSARERR